MPASIPELTEKYRISPALLANYFRINAIEKFTQRLQEFMFWRRGAFLPPHKKAVFIEQFLAEEITDYYEKQTLKLPAAQFCITTRCSLRCRDCSVMIPQFGGGGGAVPHREITFAQFRSDFDALLSAVDFVGTVLLLGGEPLLHSELPAMVEYAASSAKVGLVDIVTNCTILPAPALLAAVKKYAHKVFFGLSNYSGNAELAPVLKREPIIAALKENGIKHTLDTGTAEWFRYELKECAYTEAQMREVFAACQWHHCWYIFDGVLSICPRGLVGQELGAFKLAPDETLDLRAGNNHDRRNAIIKLYGKDVSSACRWCKFSGEKVAPAAQINDSGINGSGN